jgi:hypothetical protein
MRAQKNSKRRRAAARDNRKSLRGIAAGAAAGLILALVVIFTVPIGSPRQMVEALMVRGEKVEPAKPATTHSASAANAPASSSNTVTTTLPPTSQTSAPVLSSNTRPAQVAAEATTADGQKYLPVSFARLSSFTFKVTEEIADANADPATASQKTREQFPDTVKILSEIQVAITGFMLPMHVTHGLATDFLILKSQSACCYGVMPRINEWVIVRTTGKGVKPVMDVPVTVQGTFHVGELREDGHLTGIYELDCDRLLQTNGKL